MLWTLWAGKEAAYKAMSKGDPGICSIPRAYPVDMDPPEEGLHRGVVETPGGTVHLKAVRIGDAVHVIGAGLEAVLESARWGVEPIDIRENRPGLTAETPSLLVRERLLDRLSKSLGYRRDDMEILRLRGERGLGPPRLYVGGRPSAVDITMSHDGRFMAYAFHPA